MMVSISMGMKLISTSERGPCHVGVRVNQWA